MPKYKIEFELDVAKAWVDDGLNLKTLKRRIKEELPDNLCPYAHEGELRVFKIIVKKIVRKSKKIIL
jgi:hypothetical protein